MNTPKKITKLLLFGIVNKNYLMYLLGKHGIYAETIREIKVSNEELNNPFIVKIHFEKDSDVTNFLSKEGIKGERIFKSAMFKNTKKPSKPKALFGSTVMNLLSMLKGHTIRIKSDNKDYRTIFYEYCVEDNKKYKLGVNFDFSVYDVDVCIKEYKANDYTFIIILARGLKDILEK